MKLFSLLLLLSFLTFISCKDDLETVSDSSSPEITKVAGKTILKVIPHTRGWVALQETLQPQYLITVPRREIAWLNEDFRQTSTYEVSKGWSLIDVVTHPSGQLSAVIANVDLKRNHLIEIKMLRFKTDGSVVELELHPLPVAGERTRYFPGSLDRVRLVAYGEDVYVVARWEYNEVEASRLTFSNNQFQIAWQTQVEPDAYAGTTGIIGGGYDNFRQGDRYFFVQAGVDALGNLYVAVPSHEDLLTSHDLKFNENLLAETDPANFDWGVAILTKLSPEGERKYSRLEGRSHHIRLLNMRVSDEGVFLLGRVKTGNESTSWDAWVLAADRTTGNVKYESWIDLRQGDMFWDITPVSGGRTIAVGTTGYTQNPVGLSVSDARTACAILLDAQGGMIKEITLPQGPSQRGSEAMYVQVQPNGRVLFAGAHNAPGTHAEIYSDGFITLKDLSLE